MAWAWLGQSGHCVTLFLTNLPATACYLILGTPQDSDSDGLTDAFERLVSKTNPNLKSTDGSGMSDGWEYLYFGHFDLSPTADADGDGLSNYQEYQMWQAGYSPVAWDSYGRGISDGYEDFTGDGLANLLKPAFGGSLLSTNTTWRTDADNDGLPDLYEAMVGTLTNAVSGSNPLP